MRAGVVVVVFACFIAAVLAASSCDDAKKKFEEAFNRLGDKTTGCFDKTMDLSMIEHSFKCDKSECMVEVDRLVKTYFEELDTSVCQAQPEHNTMVAIKAKLSTCNKCIKLYDSYKLVEKSFKDKCGSVVGTANICAVGECSSLATDMYKLWDEMIAQRNCHAYNPGSCGEVMPEEEGGIYNEMYALSTSIQLYRTIPLLCSTNCGSEILSWYGQWSSTLSSEDHCLTTSAGTTDAFALAQSFFTIDIDCSRSECAEKADDLVKAFYKQNSVCLGGIPLVHKDLLNRGLDPRLCKSSAQVEDSTSFLFRYGPVAGYIILMALISVGIIFAYFVVELCYNRIVRKRRGWDQVPNLFYWRQCLGLKKNAIDRAAEELLNDQFALDEEEDEESISRL